MGKIKNWSRDKDAYTVRKGKGGPVKVWDHDKKPVSVVVNRELRRSGSMYHIYWTEQPGHPNLEDGAASKHSINKTRRKSKAEKVAAKWMRNNPNP